jgi:FkbM family methyltransferase
MEKVIAWVRHESPLKSAHSLWNIIRPIYDRYWQLIARNGIPRVINETDRLRISPRLRQTSDVYEPEVWKRLMQELRTGDTFVDVGAFVGLYSVAAGLRVGVSGRVWAFEPDPGNFSILTEHIAINGLESVANARNMAVSNRDSRSSFVAGKGVQSRLAFDDGERGISMNVIALQEFFTGDKVDVMKIDVEGFEQAVLEGALGLLKDLRRRPRAIFIEMHPFAWSQSGASSEGIMQLLAHAGYQAYSLDACRVDQVAEYCEIIARPVPVGAHGQEQNIKQFVH